jgi:hypothetical protein
MTVRTSRTWGTSTDSNTITTCRSGEHAARRARRPARSLARVDSIASELSAEIEAIPKERWLEHSAV